MAMNPDKGSSVSYKMAEIQVKSMIYVHINGVIVIHLRED